MRLLQSMLLRRVQKPQSLKYLDEASVLIFSLKEMNYCQQLSDVDKEMFTVLAASTRGHSSHTQREKVFSLFLSSTRYSCPYCEAGAQFHAVSAGGALSSSSSSASLAGARRAAAVPVGSTDGEAPRYAHGSSL